MTAQQRSTLFKDVENLEEKPSRRDDVDSHYFPSNPDTKQERDLYVTEPPPFATGKSKYHVPIPPLYGGKFRYGKKFLPSHLLHPPAGTSDIYANADSTRIDIPSHNPDMHFYRTLHVLASTQSLPEAWEAYSILSKLPPPRDHSQNPKIPFSHLHRLCRLISQNRLRSPTQFLRLLSVLYTIRKSGGTIHVFEWNSLIANAGSGWRVTRPDEFKLALDVFQEMTSGMPPGSTFSPSDYPPLPTSQPVPPDEYSYNVLINIAAKSLYGRAVRRAMSLLRSPGYSPDRITHLSLLTFFTASGERSGVRSTLLKMREQGLELGLDGVNSCIWAFARTGRMDIVKSIYRVLRHNSLSDPRIRAEHDDSFPESISDALTKLEEECVIITEDMRPNEITFTEMIQVMAYHGDFFATISILSDMLSSDNIELGAPLVRGTSTDEGGGRVGVVDGTSTDGAGEVRYTKYSPTYAVFRALFLGFSRHGTDDPCSQTWTLDNLRDIYHDYMAFSNLESPSRWQIYWILAAFDKTSGHDLDVIREVWLELEEKFVYDWGNRLHKLREIVFSDEAQCHLNTVGFRLAPLPNELPALERHIWE
ncbi:hypothetical protein PQX77_011003 [Marasmius sp. AFHP31]|nr:hypothetical protein PQX77_011003 [Marasmius sp. AFHP31]